MEKEFKIFIAINFVPLASAAFLVYRYVWFGIETVPPERMVWAVTTAFVVFCVSAFGYAVSRV